MSGKLKWIIIMFCVIISIGILGLLVSPEPIPPWRAYFVAITYGIGLYYFFCNMLTPTKE